MSNEYFYRRLMQRNKNKKISFDYFCFFFLMLQVLKRVFKNILWRVAGDRHDAAHVCREGQSHLVRRAAHRSWIRRRRKKQRKYFHNFISISISNHIYLYIFETRVHDERAIYLGQSHIPHPQANYCSYAFFSRLLYPIIMKYIYLLI